MNKESRNAGNEIDDWKDVPVGFYLIQMVHESLNQTSYHLALKTPGPPTWFDQPSIPGILSQHATKHTHHEFWQWAEANLPIWNYPGPVTKAY